LCLDSSIDRDLHDDKKRNRSGKSMQHFLDDATEIAIELLNHGLLEKWESNSQKNQRAIFTGQGHVLKKDAMFYLINILAAAGNEKIAIALLKNKSFRERVDFSKANDYSHTRHSANSGGTTYNSSTPRTHTILHYSVAAGFIEATKLILQIVNLGRF
jgi:hypothetical protein